MATQYTAGLSSGQVLTAAIMNQLGAACETYTPAWTASTTNPTLNNGSLSGNYFRVQNLIIGQIFLVVGSTTNVGAGFYRFTTPTNINGNSTYAATCQILDASAGYACYVGAGIWVTAGSNQIEFRTHGAGTFTQAVPIPLGASDQVRIMFMYERT